MKFERNSKNDSDWNLSLLRYELEQLRREREHLNSKQNERPLTIFEKARSKLISTEMTSLIRTVVSHSRAIERAGVAEL